MKLILSRKGFDSSSGGGPSPIFPDGTLFSLPIPIDDNITYGELRHVSDSLGEVNIGKVVKDLTSGRRPENRIGASHGAHLDPDINFHAYPRQEGWRGLFGQAGGTETHLADEGGVDTGDIFLFFGLFREVEDRDGHWRFVPGSSPRHILWGWLQIGEVHEQVGRTGLPELPWASHHPHLQYPGDRNTIYVASESLKIGNRFKARGEGVFPQLRDELVLTEPGRSASNWRLPRWFYPENGKPALTYHTKSNRWTRKRGDSEHVYLQSVGRGQEFVLDCDYYPDAVGWARNLILDLGAR